MSKKILQEPLVHFFLAGVLIFLLYSLLGSDSIPDNEIVVDKAGIERLKDTWQRRTNREPTPDELDGLLEDYLFEELFYREARALGLEQDDPIVRRRLVQKMTLLAESAAQQVPPPETELMEWYEAHPGLYRTEPRLGFKHIYFSQDRRDGSAEEDASALLSRLADWMKAPDNRGLAMHSCCRTNSPISAARNWAGCSARTLRQHCSPWRREAGRDRSRPATVTTWSTCSTCGPPDRSRLPKAKPE